jgi:hypothetical protein
MQSCKAICAMAMLAEVLEISEENVIVAHDNLGIGNVFWNLNILKDAEMDNLYARVAWRKIGELIIKYDL